MSIDSPEKADERRDLVRQAFRLEYFKLSWVGASPPTASR
jgi:hypothetical protein